MTQAEATKILLENGQNPEINTKTKEQFLRHCKEGHAEVVHAYLVLGMPTELHDEWGKETPLIRVAEGNHTDVIAILVKLGADLEGRDDPGDTALQTAAHWGHLSAMKKLHELGAKVDTVNHHQQSALAGALKNSKTDCYKYLLEYADPNLFAENHGSLPHFCIWNGNSYQLREVFSQSKIKINPNSTDAQGDNLLMYALKRNDGEALAILLENGADANRENAQGWTPYAHAKATDSYHADALKSPTKKPNNQQIELFIALKSGNIKKTLTSDKIASFVDANGRNALGIYVGQEGELSLDFVKQLIEKGADIHHKDINGEAVVATAISNGQTEIAKYLLSLGANPNGKEGWCECLYSVLDNSDLEMLAAMVEAGMNIQDLSHYESTFVYGMTKNKKKALELIQYLGSKGANLNILDYLIFDSVLNNLAYQLDFDRLKAFLESGADINFRDKSNENAIMKLAGKYYCTDAKAKKIAKYLLDKGIDLNVEGKYGGNAFYNAKSSSNSVVKEALENFIRDGLKKALKKAKIKDILEADADFFQAFAQTQNLATLIQWVEWKEYAVVEGLLRAGLSPNPSQAALMKFPLLVAVEEHDPKMVKLLLWHNADPNYEGKYDSFALNYAAYSKDEENKENDAKILQLLIEKGANINRTNEWGESAISSAISSENWQNMQIFMDAGAEMNPFPVGYGPIIRAVGTGNEAIVEWVLEKGANINIINHDKHNALHTAIEKDFTDIALVLIENGIDIQLADFEGQTPLIKAVNKGNEKLVEVLLQQGANPDWKDKTGQAATDYVEYRKSLKKYFKPKGKRKSDEAPVNRSLLKDKPLTALLLAIYRRENDKVMALIEKGEEIDSPNYRGDTPLMVAIATGQSHFVEKLIEKGANVLLKNDMGDEAFTLICMASGWDRIKQLLEDKGRKMHANMDDLNQQAGNSMNYDALKSAIEKGDIQKIESLLTEKKCDINCLNYNQSPLHLAVSRNDVALAELLLERGALPNVVNIYGQTPLDLTVLAEMSDLFRRF